MGNLDYVLQYADILFVYSILSVIFIFFLLYLNIQIFHVQIPVFLFNQIKYVPHIFVRIGYGYG